VLFQWVFFCFDVSLTHLNTLYYFYLVYRRKTWKCRKNGIW